MSAAGTSTVNTPAKTSERHHLITRFCPKRQCQSPRLAENTEREREREREREMRERERQRQRERERGMRNTPAIGQMGPSTAKLTMITTDIRSLYSILVVCLSWSSCLNLCIPGWCRRGMGLGDAPIGDAPRDYPTGTPALDEVARHGRLLVCLLRRRPSFLRWRKPDQCPPPSTYHPIALQWSCWPKELHSLKKITTVKYGRTHKDRVACSGYLRLAQILLKNDTVFR